MARYLSDRSAEALFVDGSLERLLPPTSVARTLWAGLGHLDFTDFDAVYCNDAVGRPAIAPKRLAAVWILALLRGTTSSVELARRCGEDIELRWLLGDARVEKSTLCAFRTQHVERLEALSTQLLASLARAGLLPGEQIAVDGTVIRAASSCQASRSRQGLKRQVARLGKVIAAKLRAEEGEDAVAALQRRQARLEAALAEMTAMGKTQDSDRITVTEPTASRKKLKNGSFAPAHNVQLTTDLGSGAVIHSDVVDQGNDCGQLGPQVAGAHAALARASQARHAAPATPGTVCADAAYHDTRQLVALEAQGIAAVVPDAGGARRPPGVAEAYRAAAFSYDAARDAMTCPQGQVLPRRKLNAQQTAVTYQAAARACHECPAKPHCCPKTKHGRSVNRPLYAATVRTVAERVSSSEGQRAMRARRITVEGAFARLIEPLHWRRCRTWGRAGAYAEALWRQLTHNLLLLTGYWQPITGQPSASG